MVKDNVLTKIYESRFNKDNKKRILTWKVLTKYYFQKFIDVESSILEIASGYGYFINNIKAKTKFALDINPDFKKYLNKGIVPIFSKSSDIEAIEDGTISNIFVSNFFEHITKDEIIKTLEESLRILKPDGKIIILQPNIRFCYKDYWMYFDHITPLDDNSLTEILESLNFEIIHSKPRFLPFTIKSRLPVNSWFIRIYLKISLLQRLFGKQALIIGKKSSLHEN